VSCPVLKEDTGCGDVIFSGSFEAIPVNCPETALQPNGLLMEVKSKLIVPQLPQAGSVRVAHNWKTVSFPYPIKDPVVIANTPSFQGGHPVVVRLRNVSPTGFEVKLQEWSYLDGRHTYETLSWMAFASGTTQLSSGLRVTAGAFSSGTRHKLKQTQTFGSAFAAKPVVFAIAQTSVDIKGFASRLSSISNQGFSHTLYHQESLAAHSRAAEIIGYVALSSGSFTLADGRLLQVTADPTHLVTHSWKQLPFQQKFVSAPLVIANTQSLKGGDTITLRLRQLEAASFQVKLEEEQSRDAEIQHVPEAVGFLALASAVETLQNRAGTNGNTRSSSSASTPLVVGLVVGLVVLAAAVAVIVVAAVKAKKNSRSSMRDSYAQEDPKNAPLLYENAYKN
jgi:hypothetical protein